MSSGFNHGLGPPHQGSLEVKMPEPTKNTLTLKGSAERTISAGASQPARRKSRHLGNFPVLAIGRIKSRGAPSSFASCINLIVCAFVHRKLLLWLDDGARNGVCRTASTTLPATRLAIGAESFAAPSAMRRSASPEIARARTRTARGIVLPTWFTCVGRGEVRLRSRQ